MADTAPTAAAARGPAAGSTTATPAPAGAAAPQAKPASPAIPVGLNEASLDSPSFRAATVHFSDQVDAAERWLDSYARATSKLTHDMLALEETINSYLAKLVPPGAGAGAGAGASVDALLDPDYTLLALGRTADGAREWWNSVLSSMRRLEGVGVEPIRSFVGADLRAFKDVRRSLDAAQKTFDTTLARYVAQSKTKEPSALREDAFAVYETRKAYLKASMDFCMLAPQLRFTLDKLLVRVSADVYKEMRRSRDGAVGAMKWSGEMERIRGWSKEMEASEAVFKRELQIARREIGESTLAAHKPSRELDDYSASTVPFLGNRGPMSVQRKDQAAAVISEKQGWLFLRVLSGKPVRTSWIRRWYYCRHGTFGWLAQGALGVVQGDEIGVLLCNVKPAVGEDRRFCFEVKTKTQSLMLQAETQAQLIEWLEVFEVAKKKAFEMSMGRDNSSLPGGFDPAFAITPASIPEFSANSLEGADEGIHPPDRMSTLPVPGPDGNMTSRSSFDVSSTAPRRSITALGTTLAREEGESGREHAARLMQKLDLHRKGGISGPEALPAPPVGAGGIASLISASHTLIPSYGTPAMVSAPSPRPAPPNLSLLLGHHPGSLAPNTMARSPVPTYLSKSAVTVAAERGIATDGPRGIAAAIMANYWGTNPWSSMYNDRSDTVKLQDIDDPFVQSAVQTITGTDDSTKSPVSPGTPITPLHRKAMSADAKVDELAVADKKNTEQFPPGYPNELKAHAAQFRLLFPSTPVDEKLVLVFNAAWASSSEDAKEVKAFAGNGRIYATPDNMYFYGHQMGLVVAYTISLDVITEVTAAAGRDCDYIFLHLGQDLNDTGFTRITVKVFLENLPLLLARLNLLIDDLQAEEPLELPELISSLVNLEKEEQEKKSPSVESWEEVSSNTPHDGGTAHGKPTSRSRVHELAYPRSRAQRSARPHVAKFQLPAHPVIYEPEGMGKPVAGRHFEISAKACFHVLFGDKSFIFPKLYFERRAIEITQGPWELQDHGTLSRQFKFKVDYVDMLGRKKPGEVTDTQTIDVFHDHITYVVTHVKTPWHLPHSQAFKIVAKVVITHVAKSKCKLAVFTGVEWSKNKAPAFSKNMVSRQATDDAANDAEELAEIATDQVRRLGPHSRTKRAIQVYGNIGQQTQVVVFTPSEADLHKKEQMIEPRTLTDMMIETVRSFMESAITSVMMWAFAGVKAIFSVVTANRVILLLLGASVLYNMVVVSQASSTWWAERRAARYMSRIGVGPNVMMSKAVYLADLEEASRGTSRELSVPRDSKWQVSSAPI